MNRLSFDRRQFNSLVVAGEPYFLLDVDGRTFLVRDRCPHRGGPLSLGRLSDDAQHIICPWHQSRITCGSLLRGAVPLVRRRDDVTVLFPLIDKDVLLRRRPPLTVPTRKEKSQ
jgi:hypothetical protein